MEADGWVYCSSCKKRVALYRRVTSGEALCKLCLFRSVVKQVRRAIHYYKMVNRGEGVLFIIRPDAVGESAVGFNVYKSATANLDLKYGVMCVSDITDCETVEKLLADSVDLFEVVSTEYSPRDFVRLIKFVESIAARVAKRLGVKFVSTPLFRDELTALSLMGLAMVSRTIFSEGLPLKIVENVKITRPFFYAISADFSMLKALGNIDISPRILLSCSEFMYKAKNLLYSSTELMYSSVKSVELLQAYAFGTNTRCKYCGAYSASDVCEVCKELSQYIESIK